MQNQFATQFSFDTKSLLSLAGTGQPVPGKGRPTNWPSLAPSVRHLICHLVWQLINTYMNMYIAGISTCFAMGAFISSITSTSVLVHLIYTCGAIHTRITCTFVSIWEIRFEHALFQSDIECYNATEMQFVNRLEWLETTSMEYDSPQYLVWKCSLRGKMATQW